MSVSKTICNIAVTSLWIWTEIGGSQLEFRNALSPMMVLKWRSWDYEKIRLRETEFGAGNSYKQLRSSESKFGR